MEVLYIDVNYKNSSTGKIVHDLRNGLNTRGHEAYVAYGRGPKTSDKNVFKFGLNFETGLHALLTRITGLTGCFSYFSTARLINYIKKTKPDIIHIHELHAYFVNIKKLIGYIQKAKIPVIWTFHCEFAYTGKCGYTLDCEKWKSQCEKCPQLKKYPKSCFFDFTRKMFEEKKKLLSNYEFTIVTPSKWLLQHVESSFLNKQKKLIVNNGIDSNVFKLYKSEQKNEKLVITVGQQIFSPIKGGKRVIELAKKMPEVKFVIIGGDKNEQPLDNLTIVQETRNQQELARWYSRANLFLMLSIKENFPTTCLEAQMCGTPILGFDAGGIKETSVSSENMFLPLNSSDEELINGINFMINQKIDKQRLSDEATKMFSNEAMVLKYLEVYENVKN